jgi:hypothetical protein
MTGSVRRSKCSTHLSLRAVPEVKAERAGRKMRVQAKTVRTHTLMSLDFFVSHRMTGTWTGGCKGCPFVIILLRQAPSR